MGFRRVLEDMSRMFLTYKRNPAELIFQQPLKKTAFTKTPPTSRLPSESSIWPRKTVIICTPSPCYDETYLRILAGSAR